MELTTIFGTLLVVFCHTGSTYKHFSGERICRRGTERPCYRLAHSEDPRQRSSFEAAREACRADGGELLSLETEDEQRLVERFVHELTGDFWIGLRRSLRHREPGVNCSSLYYWTDKSSAVFRNWQWNEPSCGREMCVVMHHRPPSSPMQVGWVNYKWNDVSCNLKHNFICKYGDEKTHDVIVTPASPFNTDAPVVSVTQKEQTITGENESVRAGVSDSSDITLNVLLITIPILLLLLLLVSAVVCYRLLVNRRKQQQAEPIYAKPGQWLSAVSRESGAAAAGILISHLHQQGSPVSGQRLQSQPPSMPLLGPQGAPFHSPLQHQPPLALRRECVSAAGKCEEDYENVPVPPKSRSVFVTNDIYESVKKPGAVEAGWVENEIYGY